MIEVRVAKALSVETAFRHGRITSGFGAKRLFSVRRWSVAESAGDRQSMAG
jgi:hypothetical protein